MITETLLGTKLKRKATATPTANTQSGESPTAASTITPGFNKMGHSSVQ